MDSPKPPLLDRFVQAQGQRTYPDALRELRRGNKQTHWIWFVFPQLRGRGESTTACKYALRDRAWALAYVGHPVPGPRPLECIQTLLMHHSLSTPQILGQVDALKLWPCPTLFADVAPQHGCFRESLQVFYAGQPGNTTPKLLTGEALRQP